jgi:YebC/PmpR family DNA-binding regulatory protein
MSGHNKWSKVKRYKAVADARKGKAYSRISREITLAAKAGGGSPEGNIRLRSLLLKAREVNMPVDNVERAIKKGTGELPGVSYEDVTYEAYGPGGVAFIVKVTTDNKNRAASSVRSIFDRCGGNLAGSGAVAFQFTHAGQILIGKDKTTEDKLMEVVLDAGADDVITTDEGYEVRCAINAFDKVLHALEKASIKTDSAEITYIPVNTVSVTSVDTACSLFRLQESLDENEDVQNFSSNEEMDDAISEAAQAKMQS